MWETVLKGVRGMERNATGNLGLTNFEKFITIVLWWQPFLALISLLFGSAPGQLKRHAKWAVLTAIAVLVASVVFGLLFAGVGYLAAGEQGVSVGGAIVGVFGVLGGLAALVNTLAVIVGRGPYFTSANPTGSRFQ